MAQYRSSALAVNRQQIGTMRFGPEAPCQKKSPAPPVSPDGNVPSLSMEPDMTVANLVSASSPTSQSRRSRLAAAANPVLAGPSTSAVAHREGRGGGGAGITVAHAA